MAMITFPRIHRDIHAHPLALIRWLLSRVVCVAQFCHRCGRRDNICWWAPPALWGEVMQAGEGGIRCIPCFHRECDERGIMLRWVPRVEARKNERGQWDVVPPDPELFPVAARYHREEQGARC